MRAIKTKFKDLKLITTKTFNDKRGFFKEVFQNKVEKKKITLSLTACHIQKKMS